MPLVMGIVVYPLVWRHWWGLTPLSEAELARLSPNISGSPMLLGLPLLRWNTASRICNAAVLGCVPGFRYLMISDRALETLPQRSVSAIVAHELGHVRNWHVAIRLLVVLAGGAMALVAIQGISLWVIHMIWTNVLTLLVPLLMCLYIAAMLSWVAPELEHQADLYALRFLMEGEQPPMARQRMAEDLIEAIGDLSRMSGLPPGRRTWLHPSWIQRRKFLLAAAKCDPLVARLERRVQWHTLVQAGILLISIAVLVGLG